VTATLVPLLSSRAAASPGILSAILASLIAYWQVPLNTPSKISNTLKYDLQNSKIQPPFPQSVLMALVVGLVTLWTTLRLLKPPRPRPPPPPATPSSRRTYLHLDFKKLTRAIPGQGQAQAR
jgi:hypothetical protein